MGEVSKYFVPLEEERFLGKDGEVAEQFWSLGIFVWTADDSVYQRIRDWESKAQPLPAGNHDFSFADMGLGGSPLFEPVPNGIYDLICPSCQTEVREPAYEAWNEDSVLPLPDRLVQCPGCHAVSRSDTLLTRETPFMFARFYLWISDIEPSDWDPAFRHTVESVLGPCREFTAWET